MCKICKKNILNLNFIVKLVVISLKIFVVVYRLLKATEKFTILPVVNPYREVYIYMCLICI